MATAMMQISADSKATPATSSIAARVSEVSSPSAVACGGGVAVAGWAGGGVSGWAGWARASPPAPRTASARARQCRARIIAVCAPRSAAPAVHTPRHCPRLP